MNPAGPSSAAYNTVAVAGAGAWGTALALVAAHAGRKVTLWAREADVVASVNGAHENKRFLPSITLPSSIAATGDLAQCALSDTILIVAPAQYVRATLASLCAQVKAGTPVVICAKGIEEKTGALLSEVLHEALPATEPAMLSGPSFARDVAMGKPTAVTIAARTGIATRLQATIGSPSFRPYATEDLTGVALGGAAKNVYAIACGMVDGAGFGESARAGLLARSFAELLRLGAAMGVRAETLMGLSGLGDLVLTATSISSRNFALGVHLGQGKRLADMLAPGQPLAEGAATAPALVARGLRHGVELPVAHAVADVLAGKLDVGQAAERLLSRPFRAE
jgi:glycerol-3-phosphate dehydrogenase (NAD(P)+)